MACQTDSACEITGSRTRYIISEMLIEYNIFNKTSTRLPESLSVLFSPLPQYGFSWMLNKLGQKIDPKSVVLNSSQYQHGEGF